MTFEEAAPLVWQILIAAADQRQILNYDHIAGKLDRKLPARALGKPLDLIALYCAERDFPALTALAVSKATGRPGAGFWGGSDVDAERERVFAKKWYAETPPTCADFQALPERDG